MPYIKTETTIATNVEKKTEGILTAYAAEIEERRRKLRKRGFPLAAEHIPPTGQAALWYQEVIQYVPRSGRDVAKQIARLAGDDSKVTIPWRSLTDAVGVIDKAGRNRAYTERGVQTLEEAGWLTVETVGEKRGAKTTFYLQVGDFTDRAWTDEEDFLEE